jgi:hypothetical protein
MKGVRFYAELPEHWRSKSGCRLHPPVTRAALARGLRLPLLAVFPSGDAVAELEGGCSAPRDYIRARCLRISETEARRLAPRFVTFMEESSQ